MVDIGWNTNTERGKSEISHLLSLPNAFGGESCMPGASPEAFIDEYPTPSGIPHVCWGSQTVSPMYVGGLKFD